RRVVAPQPQGIDQNQLAWPLREIGRELARDHSAEGMADHGRRGQSELIEQLVVAEHEVPELLERAMRFGVALAGSRMLGGVDRELARQRVEKLAPLQAVAAMEEDERGAGAGNLDPHFYLVVPDVGGTFLNCSHFRASALSWVQFKVRRRPCGRRRAWDANCDRCA